MPFVVEDGSIVTDANSLCSVSFADGYHLDRNNSAWTGTDAVKQAALIKATDYISQKYSFRGRLVEYDQPLVWPRACIAGVEYETIPTRVKAAVAELALEALTGSLSPSITPQGQVKSKKVDVIEIEYFASTSPNTSRPAIDGLIKPYLSGGGINVPVVRV